MTDLRWFEQDKFEIFRGNWKNGRTTCREFATVLARQRDDFSEKQPLPFAASRFTVHAIPNEIEIMSLHIVGILSKLADYC